MRKLLIGAIIIILLTGTGLLLFNGFKIGKLEILSIPGLSQNSKELETSIFNLKQMKEVEFLESTESLEQATVNLKEQKEQYATLVGASSETEISSTIQTEKYEMEYLWVKLGNHATKNGITLKMDVTTGATGQNKMYNLQFTAHGSYANVAEFVYQIENDSTLGFKIENFKLLPSGAATTSSSNNSTTNKTNTTNNTTTTSSDNQTLVATFTVKDVYIELEQISNSTTKNTSDTTNATTNTLTEDINTEQTTTE